MLALSAAAASAAGCGSAAVSELPAAAEPPRSPAPAVPAAGETFPADTAPEGLALPGATRQPGTASLRDGRLLAVVSGRERAVEILDGRTRERLSRVHAGVGPTHIACRETGPCYVLDTQGNGLLVLVVSADGRAARISRRVYLPGGPYGIALDERRARLWVTAPGRNELSELPAHGRPRVVRTLPTVRGPDAVAVDARTGAVVVTSRAAGLVQVVRP